MAVGADHSRQLHDVAAFTPLRVVYRSMPLGSGFSMHRLDLYTTAFLCSGEAEYSFGQRGDERVVVQRGQVLWMPKGTWRRGVFKASDNRFFGVQFALSPAYDCDGCDFCRQLFLGPVVTAVQDPGFVEGLFRRLHRLRGHRTPASYIESQGLLVQIVAAIVQANEKRDTPPHLLQRVREIEEYLLNHFSNPDLNVTGLAELAGWSVKHFIASFKQVTGQTPIAYLRRVRVNHALDLLAHDDLSVQEVAEMVGYRDAAYFSRIFRKSVGLPPSQVHVRGADPQ